MTFNALGLIEPLTRAVEQEGYTTPTPIQVKAIPHILEGRDLLGCAQTGTGKTAAFALPIIQRLHAQPASGPRRIRCLVLTPTRELASQIGESFNAYGRFAGLRHCVIFGGVGQHPQVQKLRQGMDIVVATPGRLLDLIGQGHVDLRAVSVFVLDEADRMLDMGFINDIRKIITRLPAQRQTLFFSATMPGDIEKLASTILRDPVRVSVAPVSSAAETVAQSVFHVAKHDKPALLAHLLQSPGVTRALIFTRTKHGADRVARQLGASNIKAEAIHGNKSQNARERALGGFRNGSVRVLVASDIAARGIDVEGISHVVNFDLPNEPETYVHRIGRTGRAGASGIAFSFCDGEERAFLRDIERIIRKSLAVVDDHPFRNASPRPPGPPDGERSFGRQQGRGGQGRGGGRSGYGQRGGGRQDPPAQSHQAEGHAQPGARQGQAQPARQGSGARRPNGRRPGGPRW